MDRPPLNEHLTGAEHFEAAESLLKQAAEFGIGTSKTRDLAIALTAQAQVHATLALAAATAMNQSFAQYNEMGMRPGMFGFPRLPGNDYGNGNLSTYEPVKR